ncbi:MAG: CBS domain-containing protein [candidate division WOR-3 bacterium]|nr:CBS domain-containing protein [candidate division WOR-3 bacterium]
MLYLIISLLIFVLIIALIIFIRVKFGAKFEIKTSDILIALIPIALWLLLTKKIQKFEIAGFKMELAFVEALEAKINKQITPVKLPVEYLRIGLKQRPGEIPQLVRDKIEALSFQLGDGDYHGPAIEEYLRRLSEHPFFKFIIINNENRRFTGIVEVRKLLSAFLTREGDFKLDNFAQWINENDTLALYQLPGFVSAKDGIRKDTDKQTALEKMDSLNIETLPVVDEHGKFAGVVDRSRLTASLIIDVANKLK